MLSLSIFMFVAFLMLFLGSVVFVHDPRSRVNKLFFAWVFFSVAWMAFNYLENVSSFSLSAREMLLRADFASAVIAVGFIMLFVVNFIDAKVTLRKLFRYFLPPLAMAVASFTPWMFYTVYLAEAGEIRFTEGYLFYLYAPVIIVYFILPCILLIRNRRNAQPAMRAQMSSVATGLVATATVSLTVNLFLQNVLSAEWFRVGIYSVLFFIVGVAWAIAKHEFLKIRFVIVEILFLGILATLLTRTILSKDLAEAVVNAGSFAILLVLGFAMVRSFLNEEHQRIELQKLTERLEISNKRLKQLDELKTTMVGIASHQIRGPLGGIRGYLSMFQSGDLGPLNTHQKEIIALNQNVLSRLINAVETFLDITKLESGKIMLSREVTSLDEVVGGIIEEFRVPMLKRTLDFVYEVSAPTPITVRIDPEKTKHIVFNLIDNALKYTQKGKVSVRLRVEEGNALCEITDTGMGIPEADVPRLFGKFERGELVVDRGGSGLGLYVVKMLTEMQGGRVWVTSPGVEKGATFTVSFPLAK